MNSINKNKIEKTYKSKFVLIFILSSILTIVSSFTFLKNENVSILSFISKKIDDSEILDISIHAGTELDNSLLNLYIVQSDNKILFDTGSSYKVDGEYFYRNFQNIFDGLIAKETKLLMKISKINEADKYTIMLEQQNKDTVKLEEIISKIFFDTEVLLKKKLLSQVNLVREEKVNSLAIMDDIISESYTEKFKLIINNRNKLLDKRLSSKKLTDLINIKNIKQRPFNKVEDLLINSNSKVKYGQIILIFIIFHFMIFFIILFLNLGPTKKSLKARK